MAEFKACCDVWLQTLQPLKPKEGIVQERHQCRTCKGWHVVSFDCGPPVLGSTEPVCTAVGIVVRPDVSPQGPKATTIRGHETSAHTKKV
jgi:hypothetical protein